MGQRASSVGPSSRSRPSAAAIGGCDLRADGGPRARAGTFDDAASFGDVVLYTLRDVPPTKLLADGAGALDGKVLVDCNNSDFVDAVRFTAPVATPERSIAAALARDVPRARVVKAFNTHPAPALQLDRDALRSQRVSAFVCGDDPAARKIVGDLAVDVGLVPVDSGELEHAYLLEGLADFLRFQIGGVGLGPFATISLHVLETGKSDV